MKSWTKISATILALSSLVFAQRGGFGGGGMRGAGVASRGGGHFGGSVAVGAGGGRGFVPFHSGFVNGRGFGFRGGFRGAVSFGHNPRFHVGFGTASTSCFINGFCGSSFAVPVVAYPYVYPVPYAEPYVEYQESSPYTVVQGESGYPAAYDQGATAQQVKDLSTEVQRLRAELDERDATVRAVSNPKETVQELPLNVTLVMRDGRKMQIHNYAVVGQTIWSFDEKTASKIPVPQVDLAATKRANEENGVLFLLPGMK